MKIKINRNEKIAELAYAIQGAEIMIDNSKKEKERLIKLREKYMCMTDEEFEAEVNS